ncbi:MAG TPA: hypothetical protein PLP75_08950 [Burkholderiales bacterium]|jgi:hypothetical protein|nr:hypothetical protein [Burkholderiales bacterium]
MNNFNNNVIFLVLSMSYSSLCFANNIESGNIFKYYDNNLSVAYEYGTYQDTSTQSGIGISAEALFDNNLWLNGSALGLLTYDITNNNQGLNNLLQNKSGSSFTLRGGYAFNVVKDLNFIPYIGFNYSNMLVDYNYDSVQYIVFENPSFNTMLGIINEYNIIDKRLKLRLDIGLDYSVHEAVLPNSNQNLANLGHISYSYYALNISPELQYNITNRITISGSYTLGNRFAGNANPVNVYFPSINVNSANALSDSGIYNIFGLKLGVLF